LSPRHAAVAGLGLALLWALAGGALGRGEKGPAAASISRRALDNGLELVFQRDASSALTILTLAIKGGQRDEAEGQAGLSFLTTRLLLEIPDNQSAQLLMQQSSSTGMASLGDLSLISLEAISSNFDRTVDIMTGPWLDPLFSGLRVDRVKKSMLHRGQLQLDDPQGMSREAQFAAVFGTTPYGLPVRGTEASLESLSGHEVSDFYRTHFRAGNIVLVVISDLEEETVAGILEKRLRDVPRGEAVPPAPLKPFPDAARPTYLDRKTNQTVISYAYRLPALSARNYALAVLAESLLGQGVASRLWPLRQKEMLAYNVGAVATLNREAGILEAYLETDEARKDRAAARLREVLTEAWERGVGSEEMATLKAMARADFWRDNETRTRRAPNLAYWEAVGLDAEFYFRLPEEVDAVTVAEFNAYLRASLDPERASRVVVGPNDVAALDSPAPARPPRVSE
jgi:zinc protease